MSVGPGVSVDGVLVKVAVSVGVSVDGVPVVVPDGVGVIVDPVMVEVSVGAAMGVKVGVDVLDGSIPPPLNFKRIIVV